MKKLLSLLIFIFTANSFAMDMACRISNMKPGVDSSIVKKFTLDPSLGNGNDIRVYLANEDISEVTELVEHLDTEGKLPEIKKDQSIFFVYSIGDEKNTMTVSIGKANSTFAPVNLGEVIVSGVSSNEERVNFDYTAAGQGSVALINNKGKLLFACGLYEIIYGEK